MYIKQLIYSCIITAVFTLGACESKKTESPEEKPGPFSGKIMRETFSDPDKSQWLYYYQTYGLEQLEKIEVVSKGQIVRKYGFNYSGVPLSQYYTVNEYALQQGYMSTIVTTEHLFENGRLNSTEYRPFNLSDELSHRQTTFRYGPNGILKSTNVITYNMNGITFTEDQEITTDENGNVIKIFSKIYFKGQLQSSTSVIYTYDDKKKPKKGLVPVSDIAVFFSPNNWLTSYVADGTRKPTTRTYYYNNAGSPGSCEEMIDGVTPNNWVIEYYK